MLSFCQGNGISKTQALDLIDGPWLRLHTSSAGGAGSVPGWESKMLHGQKNKKQGLLWWLSAKESACQCRRHGFNPWSGKIPHAAERLSLFPRLLSLCSRARESQLLNPRTLEPMIHKKRGHHNESLCAATRESPLLTAAAPQERKPSAAKNK